MGIAPVNSNNNINPMQAAASKVNAPKTDYDKVLKEQADKFKEMTDDQRKDAAAKFREEMAADQARYDAAKKPKANDPKQAYGKDMFLKLMVSQLKHQDPIEPMKNEDFLAQMAQFTSVEQLGNLTKSFEEFSSSMKESTVSSAKAIENMTKVFQESQQKLLDRISSLEQEVKKLSKLK